MTQASPDARRSEVLDAALRTFARFGYRKTSMDDVAKEARISRPGLYFLFASKGGLFAAAAEQAIERDLTAAEQALTSPERPLVDRVIEAFDCWAGRYIGPMQDATGLIADNPELLGPIALAGPARFEALLDEAMRQSPIEQPDAVVQTLLSVSIGAKQQAIDRSDYRARMALATRLLIVTR